MTVFQRYTDIKKELGITQLELAGVNKVTQSALSQKEANGNISIPTLEYIRKTYNVNLNWLFTGEGERVSTKESIIIQVDIRELEERIKELEDDNERLEIDLLTERSRHKKTSARLFNIQNNLIAALDELNKLKKAQ